VGGKKANNVLPANLNSYYHCVARKIKATFLLPKKPNFKPFQSKNTSPALLKDLQTNSSAQNI
jgi:hypothetical protein